MQVDARPAGFSPIWLSYLRDELHFDGLIELTRPFGSAPDLLQPRALLRIVPGKLSGEPHIEGTRITTAAVFALASAGYQEHAILQLYPDLNQANVREAIQFERSISRAA